MAHLDDALERWLPGLTAAPAFPHLRSQLTLRWVDGTAPRRVVEEATWYRGTQSLTEADDPAAALAWRIAGTTPPSNRDAPLPWLPDVLPVLRQDAETSNYLDRPARRVEQLAERVAVETQQAGASDRMPWRRALPPDVDDQLLADLAVWHAAHAMPSTGPNIVGPPMTEPGTVKYQAQLVRPLRRQRRQ
ncbi:hypothetical protein [uncultured Ornithinimicrobium sp.]|uniref:hypothetical protein n=1 Tax=uncultured Ornithinimicrobium sp. TaxID=259307 RepID=UPI0025979562|nr:hypothetical protein [uncultured Ornithinimicrobium sp.]